MNTNLAVPDGKLKKVNRDSIGNSQIDYKNGTINGEHWDNPVLLTSALQSLSHYTFYILRMKIEKCKNPIETEKLKEKQKIAYAEIGRFHDIKGEEKKNLVYKIYTTYAPESRAYNKQQKLEQNKENV